MTIIIMITFAFIQNELKDKFGTNANPSLINVFKFAGEKSILNPF